MSAELVCLTLIAARSLRDELFDYLNEQRDLVSGFTGSGRRCLLAVRFSTGRRKTSENRKNASPSP